MVVDTSALVAIILEEPGHDSLGRKILESEAVMAAPNVLEAHMVLAKFLGPDVGLVLKTQLAELGITVIPFTSIHAVAASEAFERYGKGRHPASLNFGDCMAYALAKVAGAPILFTGNDFTRTDILLP